MEKVLILGGSYRDISLIKACKELGYYTITLGSRDDYIGHRYADSFYKENYNDFELIKKIISDEDINYLIPGSGEEPYMNVVKLSNELNIGNYDTYENAQVLHNKWKFKEFCLKHNLCVAKGEKYKDNLDLSNLSFPLIIKPVSMSGGKGTTIVSNKEELEIALDYAKKYNQEILIEEVIDGDIFSYSVVISNKKVIYEFTAREYTYINKYIISSAHSCKLDTEILKLLKDNVEVMSNELSMVDGMFHLQVIIKDNTPYIIDVTRRIAGDLYPDLIEKCDDVQYLKSVVQAYTGNKISDEFLHKNKKQKFLIRQCLLADRNGEFINTYINDKIKNKIVSQLDLISSGTIIDDYLNTLIGIVFIQLDKYDEEFIINLTKLIYPKIIENEL